MKLLDSRRYTGANLLMDGPGPVVDVEAAAEEVDAVVTRWRANVEAILAALGLGGAELYERRFAGGVSLGFRGPIDVLYALCDVNEWALEGGDVAEAAARFQPELDKERNPKLLALQAAAREHGVAFLWCDDLASVGLGTGSQSWLVGRLPDPAAVDWSKVHDVPVVLVTGTNGKSTTVRLLAAMVEADGKVPGISSTDWVRIGDAVLDTGDYSGPGGARMVLRDPRCEVAILETARGGMLRRGLGVERADAAAVLNVAEDHLGEWGIGDLAGLVETKFLVEKALVGGGTLVLNADEPPVLERGKASPATTILYSLDGDHPEMIKQVDDGGDAAFVEDGTLFFLRHGMHEALITETRIPISYGGRARFNTSNALAASALAACAGISNDAIAKALETFESSPATNPGRGNLFDIGGVTVFADFAHNPHGTHALAGMAKAFGAARLAVLLGQAGDRTDDDVRALVESTVAAEPDLIVVKEMAEILRGREPGAVVALIDAELERLGVPAERIAHADSELAAVEHALDWAQPGDLLLLLLHAQRDEALALLEARRSPS